MCKTKYPEKRGLSVVIKHLGQIFEWPKCLQLQEPQRSQDPLQHMRICPLEKVSSSLPVHTSAKHLVSDTSSATCLCCSMTLCLLDPQDAVSPRHVNPSESTTAPAQLSRCFTEAQHSKSCFWCRSDGLSFDGADAAPGLTSTASCFVVLLLGESVWELCTPLSTALQLKRGGWWPPHLKTSQP